MPRRPASFSQADARRACRAAPDRVVEITLPDGTVIKLVPKDDVTPDTKKREIEL